MSYTSPQTAKVTTSTNVTWSSGALFSGYLMFGVALPTDSLGAQWAQLNLYGTSQRLPIFTIIPIIEGVVDQNTSVYLTTQLDPPNTRYVAYWYDNTWKLIYPFPSGTIPSPFSVTTQPYIITQPTLTVPTVPTGAEIPAPQTDDSTTGSGPIPYAAFDEFVLTGTADGVNTIFTIPVTPLISAAIFIDGQKQDQSTYTRSVTVVTFNTPPTSGASVTALVV